MNPCFNGKILIFHFVLMGEINDTVWFVSQTYKNINKRTNFVWNDFIIPKKYYFCPR